MKYQIGADSVGSLCTSSSDFEGDWLEDWGDEVYDELTDDEVGGFSEVEDSEGLEGRQLPRINPVEVHRMIFAASATRRELRANENEGRLKEAVKLLYRKHRFREIGFDRRMMHLVEPLRLQMENDDPLFFPECEDGGRGIRVRAVVYYVLRLFQ